MATSVTVGAAPMTGTDRLQTTAVVTIAKATAASSVAVTGQIVSTNMMEEVSTCTSCVLMLLYLYCCPLWAYWCIFRIIDMVNKYLYL